MATVKRRSTVPYYASAGTWVIYALLFPLYRVPHFLFVAVVSGVVFFIMNAVCGTVRSLCLTRRKRRRPPGIRSLTR